MILRAQLLDRRVDGEARGRRRRSRTARRSARGSRSSGSSAGRSPASSARRCRAQPLEPPRMLGDRRPPRDVVHGARARDAGAPAAADRSAIVPPRCSPRSSQRRCAGRLRAHDLVSSARCAPGRRCRRARLEALERHARRDLGMIGDQRLVGASCRRPARGRRPSGSANTQRGRRRARPRRLGRDAARSQNSSASRRADAPDDAVHHARAGAAAARARGTRRR